jgi:hypothetical protein
MKSRRAGARAYASIEAIRNECDDMTSNAAAREECPSCKAPVAESTLHCDQCGKRIEHLLFTQSRGYSCGPAAMRNALSILGLTADEAHLRKVMGAKAWVGTPDEGFVSAAHALGIEHAHVRDGTIEALRDETQAGNPCIVDWRHGQHYVCVLAVTDRHVIFADSNPRDTELVRVLTHARFLQLWWDSEDTDDRHHAMHVFRPPPSAKRRR